MTRPSPWLRASGTGSSDEPRRVYIDKLDCKIDEDFYRRMKFQSRDKQDRCQRDIGRHSEASDAYLDEGVALLALALNAYRLFELRGGAEAAEVGPFELLAAPRLTWR
ncbi:MAG: resolvase [Rhodospirillales bacterium]|nr:resolvase [Rhodospirillales bacterium]